VNPCPCLDGRTLLLRNDTMLDFTPTHCYNLGLIPIPMKQKKLISYVLPVYNEQEGLEEFYTKLEKTLQTVSENYNFEFVFINDGSGDNSFNILQGLFEKDSRVKVINFSKNFGHQMAITAGLDMAEGEAVIIMDTDLQDPPEASLKLVEKWQEGFDVVYAQREQRSDGALKKLTAYIFYRTLDILSEVKIPKDTGDFRLLDRKVVLEMRKFRETNRFMRGLTSYVGFKQTAVLFNRDKRFAGETHYTFTKMFKLAFDGITSFSTVPLKLITQFGFYVSIISFIGIIYALVVRIFYPEMTVQGTTFAVISVLFMGGVQMVMLGILGEYVGRIYQEVQQRPLYIVSSVLSKK
jgi:dolichol-phosphate mannosyltransferase